MNDTINLGKFPLGKNNVSPETDLPEGALREALNVDIDKEGNVSLRDGYELVYSGSDIHSLYKNYFIESGVLKYLESDNSATIISSSFSNNNVAYCDLNGKIVCTDGSNNWLLNNKLLARLGVKSPLSTPTLSTITGSLPAGQYQIAIQFFDSNTGEFSGSSEITSISVDGSQSIQLNDIPQPDDIGCFIMIYASVNNGSELYHIATVPHGTTNHTIHSISSNNPELWTQNLSPLPAGHAIAYCKGRLYIANDNVVWYSEPQHYGLHKTSKNFWQFPDRVTVLIAVEIGLFIVSDQTYFIPGSKPEEAYLNILDDAVAVEGTAINESAENFGIQTTGDIAYWFSNKGPVIGLQDGTIQFLTDKRVASPASLTAGATLYKEHEGVRQMITSMTQAYDGGLASIGASDSASITVIRNGVVI